MTAKKRRATTLQKRKKRLEDFLERTPNYLLQIYGERLANYSLIQTYLKEDKNGDIISREELIEVAYLFALHHKEHELSNRISNFVQLIKEITYYIERYKISGVQKVTKEQYEEAKNILVRRWRAERLIIRLEDMKEDLKETENE